MSGLIDMVRAIVRDELGRQRPPVLAWVTAVHPGDGGDGNHQLDVKLRGSGAELSQVPVTVPRLGFSILPREQDLVLVVFVDGDLNAPVVVGSLYDADHQPPQAGPLDAVYEPDDPRDSEVKRLHITTPGGGLLTIDDDGLHLTLGGTELDIVQDGDVTVRSVGTVSIEADAGMTLSSSGNLSLESTASVTIKGVSVTVEGQGAVNVKGAAIGLAGTTSFSPS
jgi:hypothetical protein